MKIRWILLFILGFTASGFAQSNTDGANFQGLVGIYSPQMDGQKTASGETYTTSQLTAAHATLPFGTRIRVTNFSNGKSVVLKINDRLPSSQGRVLKISTSGARSLGFEKEGVAYARVDVLGKDDSFAPPIEEDKIPPKVEAQITDDDMSARVTPSNQQPESMQEPTNEDPDAADIGDDEGAEKDTTPVNPVVPEKTDVQKPEDKPINVNRIFVIQFGAFSTKNKAVLYQATLQKQGIATYYSKEGKVGMELYKVRESKIYRDLQEVFAKVIEYKRRGLDCFAVGKFFVAKDDSEE